MILSEEFLYKQKAETKKKNVTPYLPLYKNFSNSQLPILFSLRKAQ
jgi:hypothetical protein